MYRYIYANHAHNVCFDSRPPEHLRRYQETHFARGSLASQAKDLLVSHFSQHNVLEERDDDGRDGAAAPTQTEADKRRRGGVGHAALRTKAAAAAAAAAAADDGEAAQGSRHKEARSSLATEARDLLESSFGQLVPEGSADASGESDAEAAAVEAADAGRSVPGADAELGAAATAAASPSAQARLARALRRTRGAAADAPSASAEEAAPPLLALQSTANESFVAERPWYSAHTIAQVGHTPSVEIVFDRKSRHISAVVIASVRARRAHAALAARDGVHSQRVDAATLKSPAARLPGALRRLSVGAGDDVDHRATVSFLLCTVTCYANLAHSLTRSP